MATTFNPNIENILEPTNNFGFGEFNYQPLSDFSGGEKYLGEYSQAVNIGTQYPNYGGTAGSTFGKQGLSSDVRHTLGASAGKDMLIDWASQFGIDKSGGLANLIGNTGIVASTALQEIPDAWRALKMAPTNEITSGNVFTQSWEDVLANLDALQIPYGTDVSDKMDYIPGIKKWMADKRATTQGIAQVAMQKQIQQAQAAAAQQSAAQQVRQNIRTYGNRDRPNIGINRPGGGRGQSPTGGDVQGTPFNMGGLARLLYYGGLV